jgi:hypothetical protein
VAGYSGTPLAKKLGIKESFVVATVNQPANYLELLDDVPPAVRFTTRVERKADLVHLFVTQRGELARALADYRSRLDPKTAVWVSWPKKASKVHTDITEDVIRDVALPLGFVDVKVCAVDETWSGLKLVVRLENR